MHQINRPRTTTLDTIATERRAPIARVRLARSKPCLHPNAEPSKVVPAESCPDCGAVFRSLPSAAAEGSGPAVSIPLDDIAEVVASTVSPDELARRVREKLVENGSDPRFAEIVIRPGFFANEGGLENVARALGVLAADEVVGE